MAILATVSSVLNRHSNLIAGALTLVAALLSIVLVLVSQSRNEVAGTNVNLEAEVTRLQRENGSLRQQVNLRDGTIETLEQTHREQVDRIEQLQGQLPALV